MLANIWVDTEYSLDILPATKGADRVSSVHTNLFIIIAYQYNLIFTTVMVFISLLFTIRPRTLCTPCKAQ